MILTFGMIYFIKVNGIFPLEMQLVCVAFVGGRGPQGYAPTMLGGTSRVAVGMVRGVLHCRAGVYLPPWRWCEAFVFGRI